MTPERLALHTYTNRPWNIHECLENYARRGLGGVSIWRETIAGEDLKVVRKHLQDSKLKPISLVRGGFFTGPTKAARDAALETNRQALRECEALGLPMMVMVCGATPGQTPAENLDQIAEGLAALLPDAVNAGVRLALEPLHPVYAPDRSAVCTMKAANDLCDRLHHPNVGVALDVYHVWWDADLPAETRRCAAAKRLFAYHICDYKNPVEHPLLDRGIPGEGVIPLRYIHDLVMGTGFDGLVEVEIFSRRWWGENQHRYLDEILSSCARIYA